MRIAVVGTRGMPGVHGGVERHCEELYPRIAEAGHEVRVYARAGYVKNSQIYRGVEVEVLPAPGGRGLEALLHTGAGIQRAARDGCDVLHFHSLGPCALIPMAKAWGLHSIVATLHAPDYLQRKWGPAAQAFLRHGERLGARAATETICVAEWYGRMLRDRYGSRVSVIPNGPGLGGITPSADALILDRLDIRTHKYVLFVGRLVPDKRVEDLIAAARLAGVIAVVAGDSADSDSYADELRSVGGDTVRFPGYVYGQDIVDLYSNAAVFVLPSSVEGLPISALEAMSLRVPVVMSDIAANREVADDGRCAILYPCGDVGALVGALAEAQRPSTRDRIVKAASLRMLDIYDWDRIAARTIEVYRESVDR